MKNCPTCRQALPVEVQDLWRRVKLAGHNFRCQCVFCRGDVAGIIHQQVKAKSAAAGEPRKTRKRKPRRPRVADYESVNRAVLSLRVSERDMWPVDPAVVRMPPRVLGETFPDDPGEKGNEQQKGDRK